MKSKKYSELYGSAVFVLGGQAGSLPSKYCIHSLTVQAEFIVGGATLTDILKKHFG